MPGRSGQRRRRNRHPRPGLVISPPSPIGIAAILSLDPDCNHFDLTLAPEVNYVGPTAPAIYDITTNTPAALVVPYFNNSWHLDVSMGAATVGHLIGWTSPPPELTVAQLSLATKSAVTGYEGPP